MVLREERIFRIGEREKLPMKKIKKKTFKKKPFIIELNEELDRKVDAAMMLIEKGSIDQGAVIMEGLMSARPNYHSVQYGMGIVYALSRRYDEAISCFKRALEIFPYFVEAQFNLATAYKEKLDLGNAVRAFRKVTEISDSNNELARQAGSFLSDLEEHIRKNEGISLDLYLKAMDIFKEACDCMERQEWEKAIASFRACLHISKDHYQSYGNIGLCYAKLGKREEALASFDKSLQINPLYEPAIVNRAVVAGMKDDEDLPEGPVEVMEYEKDYTLKKKSYIAGIINSTKHKLT